MGFGGEIESCEEYVDFCYMIGQVEFVIGGVFCVIWDVGYC